MDLEGKNATFTTPPEFARICMDVDRVLTF